MKNKLILGGVVVVLLVAFLAWLFIESSKPLPGQKQADLGRGHVPIGTPVEYNSNPPTSGPHYEEWVRAGVYETPKDDRNLVHSLEHGYTIMSYNCEKKVQSSKPVPSEAEGFKVKSVYAHVLEDEATDSAEATSGGLPRIFHTQECEDLKAQLASVYEKKGKRKLIVIPRVNLDSRIALTAWTYLDKFDPFDESRIEKFIDAHRDQGPERTME